MSPAPCAVAMSDDQAAYRIFYDDASHFSPEYKRHFGEPPMRDVERLRELAGAHIAPRAVGKHVMSG
jgi:AraC-like DNA-binding protein